MYTKTKTWIFVLTAILITVSTLLSSSPDQTVSAKALDANSNSCLTCHDDLYYLYDSGKYYCITEHKDRCVNCHEGNASVMDEDQAHFGLILHPQENDGARCQQCHADDAQTKLATFASLSGGYKTVIEPVAYTPKVKEETSGFPVTTEDKHLTKNLVWLAGAVTIFGIWLALVYFSPKNPNRGTKKHNDRDA